jgi:tRNA1Val (adenine37-N6)-methyltransferase
MEYKQPEFYRFSEDSTYLAKFVSDEYSESENDLIIADYGAGCGVVAIEFALRHKRVKKIFFIEVQKEFIPFINENIKLLPSRVEYEVVNKPFSQTAYENHFDLVFSNPPYFRKGTGRISQSANKQICRTFEIDDFELLLQKINSAIKKSGRAFLVLRDIRSCHKQVSVIAKKKNAVFCEVLS